MATHDARLTSLRLLIVGACGLAPAACGGIAILDEGQGGATGTTSGSTGRTAATTVAASSSSGNACALVGDQVEACLTVKGCPPATNDLAFSLARSLEQQPCEDGPLCSCNWKVDEVHCLLPGETCCYAVDATVEKVCMGLPFLVGQTSRVAPLVEGETWAGAWNETPSAWGDLDRATRTELASAYRADALAEHASVASFARLVLSLLSFGAPASLIEEAQRALGDEVRHARLCFAIARSYDGLDRVPGQLGVSGALDGRLDVASFVESVVEEGCIGETIAALRAARACEGVPAGALRTALASIADDEARHAALSYRVVAFMIRRFGETARRAAERTFVRSLSSPITTQHHPSHEAPSWWSAHGRLSPAQASQASADALTELVRPGARSLLAVAPGVETSTATIG